MHITNTCMGLFEFKDDYFDLFNQIVKPLVESHTGLTYVSAQSYYESKTLKMDLISRMIKEARLIIIDISENNLNVFIELGIAYAFNKPMVLLCSKKKWGKRGKLPFDMQHREVLIYSDKKDLKVKLGRFISDAMHRTEEITLSWFNPVEDASRNSPRVHFHSPSQIRLESESSQKPCAIWSTTCAHSNFVLGFHVNITKISHDSNPDIRTIFTTTIQNYPQIISIHPWEYSEINSGMYECHIDYFFDSNNHDRITQLPVTEKQCDRIKDFDVFISFCIPNMVFEATCFEEGLDRLIVSMQDFSFRRYPLHMGQYIGFEVRDCKAIISDIFIKNVYQ